MYYEYRSNFKNEGAAKLDCFCDFYAFLNKGVRTWRYFY